MIKIIKKDFREHFPNARCNDWDWLINEKENTVGFFSLDTYYGTDEQILILRMYAPNDEHKDWIGLPTCDILFYLNKFENTDQAKEFAINNYDRLLNEFLSNGTKQIGDLHQYFYPRAKIQIPKTKKVTKQKEIEGQISLF